MLTQQELRERFDYDPEGFLVWKSQWCNRVKEGDKAGQSLTGNGYRQCGYGRHAVAVWVWHNGAVPEGFEVDHKDRNKTNDRIDNLRLKTRTQNNYNTKQRSDSTQAAKGIEKRGKGYRAYFSYKGKKKTVGVFPTVEEAVAARELAMRDFL